GRGGADRRDGRRGGELDQLLLGGRAGRPQLVWQHKGLVGLQPTRKAGASLSSGTGACSHGAAWPVEMHSRRHFAPARSSARLGIPYLVAHPGAHCGAGEDAGLRTAARSLGEVLEACRGFTTTIALENTAGQGTQIGWRFEQLGRLCAETRGGERLRVCLDTEHAFAAGYDLRSAAGYTAALAELDANLGIDRIVAFHLNDAKCALGGRLDRHEHIGRGGLGLGAFRRLLRDRRFHGLPMCIETPKGADLAEDRRNLAVLRRLA